MRITFCLTDTKAPPWLEGFQAAFPDAAIEQWARGSPPADYAVVWAPPQQLFDEQTALRGVFNIGAGVDALAKLRIRSNVPVVRLDDAGMSVQMTEYVCHAVIRHFREFDGYEADVAAGKWSYRKPRARKDWPVGVMGLGVLGERVSRALKQFDFPASGRRRSDHPDRQWAAGRRDAGRVSHGAAAGRASILETPENNCHAAHLGAHAA